MRIQSDFKFEELSIGMKITNGMTGLVSEITDLTSNSVEVFNRKSSKEGIDSKNWYTLDNFNRKFTK